MKYLFNGTIAGCPDQKCLFIPDTFAHKDFMVKSKLKIIRFQKKNLIE
jgi:hypothetical protein